MDHITNSLHVQESLNFFTCRIWNKGHQIETLVLGITPAANISFIVLEVSGKMGTVYCILLCCGLFHLKEIKWPPFF